MPENPKKVCFVISPIGGDDSPERKKADQLLKYILKPVLQEKGYEVKRADNIHDPGTISKQIIEHLVTAPMVVADMTGHNPNVFYELAVRHAAQLPVVHMIEKGETIPFDVAPQRAIFYELDLEGVDGAKDALGKMLDAIAVSGDEGDSPLSNALERITLGRSGDAGERESDLLEIVQDIQLRMVNMESLLPTRMTGGPSSIGFLSGEFANFYSVSISLINQLSDASDSQAGVDVVIDLLVENVNRLANTFVQVGVLTAKDLEKLRHPSRLGMVAKGSFTMSRSLTGNEAIADKPPWVE